MKPFKITETKEGEESISRGETRIKYPLSLVCKPIESIAKGGIRHSGQGFWVWTAPYHVSVSFEIAILARLAYELARLDECGLEIATR